MFRKDKLAGFFRKNGFYLVLAICVLGVGIGTFFGIRGESETPEENLVDIAELPPEEKSEQVQAIVTPKPTLAPKIPEPSAEEKSKETEEEDQPAAKRVSGTKITLKMPLEGEIIKAFSGETLVHNPTLNMWMTHNGIDIAAQDGEQVKAALAGVVEEVKNDDSKGLMVTISHGNNGRTIYVGLLESNVKSGDKINAGQTVGKVGTPAFESAQGPHLHFEYVVDGVYMDPVEYMD